MLVLHRKACCLSTCLSFIGSSLLVMWILLNVRVELINKRVNTKLHYECLFDALWSVGQLEYSAVSVTDLSNTAG